MMAQTDLTHSVSMAFTCVPDMLFLQVPSLLVPLAPLGLNSKASLVGHSLIGLLKTATIPSFRPPEFPVPPPHFISLHSS